MTKFTEDHFNYQRIADAIELINSTYTLQPSLGELAEKANVSAHHYQKLFTEWVGVSPKKFMQYLTVRHAKRVLAHGEKTLFQAAYESGLSGTGRLHDLFISLESMTPGAYKSGGKNLQIDYSYYDSPFGKLLIAATDRGICHMAFCNEEEEGLSELANKYTSAEFSFHESDHILQVKSFFNNGFQEEKPIHLHLSGTPFQMKVWESLMKIPSGALATYKAIASDIGQPTASRAVGTAIGANPVAYLIPCHRVIQSTGHFGGYMWGKERKQLILGWEGARHPLND